MTQTIDIYRSAVRPVVPSPTRFTAYQKLLFRGVHLAGRSLLDIGGGNGVMSFYAAARGAGPVVCLEPAAAGSNVAMERQYRLMAAELGTRVDVELRHERFQDLGPGDRKFDIVLIHNAINHLDEEACAALPASAAARSYEQVFRKLADLMTDDGDLIVTDCARRNLWGDLQLPNVFAPSIDWRIHQQPDVWAGLMRRAGFQTIRVRWDSPSRLRGLGQLVLGNRVGGYLTNSHFIISAKRAA
ncbi:MULTISPECIES: class I SAM-dependent methyltransferase [unclassified Solwaraspora]|uniref:class I SAM-dependent methyltransferase n=1 Tax=unclassified Solwaraspora TaxID=2627926 RepID=UPI00259BBD26|nr:class I SAM-dependent methyltransferase [Solwaraspora sp. WMMA2056]WJK41768.1 class I SAM-dependent methyltransferase [Solwaraspora sp. WMMA2056]